MFPSGDKERCPIKLLKLYLEKQAVEIKTSGPFYRSVIDKRVSSFWYKKTAMGKQKTNKQKTFTLS